MLARCLEKGKAVRDTRIRDVFVKDDVEDMSAASAANSASWAKWLGENEEEPSTSWSAKRTFLKAWAVEAAIRTGFSRSKAPEAYEQEVQRLFCLALDLAFALLVFCYLCGIELTFDRRTMRKYDSKDPPKEFSSAALISRRTVAYTPTSTTSRRPRQLAGPATASRVKPSLPLVVRGEDVAAYSKVPTQHRSPAYGARQMMVDIDSILSPLGFGFCPRQPGDFDAGFANAVMWSSAQHRCIEPFVRMAVVCAVARRLGIDATPAQSLDSLTTHSHPQPL